MDKFEFFIHTFTQFRISLLFPNLARISHTYNRLTSEAQHRKQTTSDGVRMETTKGFLTMLRPVLNYLVRTKTQADIESDIRLGIRKLKQDKKDLASYMEKTAFLRAIKSRRK